MSGETSPVVAPPSPGLGLPAESPDERPGPAAPRPARGLRAVGPRFLQVWYRDAHVFAKLWKTNLFPPLIEPFLYLLALGIGVGYYVRSIDGVGYLAFVAPGIIVTTSVLQATFECTYSAYFRMAFQSTYDAIVSTPVNPEELSLGEIGWGATRALINAAAVVFALTVVGRMPIIWILPVLALQFLAGVHFAALSLNITSRVHQTEYFNFYLSGIIFPVQMLTGAYFPLSRIPEFLHPLAWAVPLTSMIDLTRGMVLGRLGWHSLLELAYILVTTVIFVELALRSMRRRLIA